MASFRMDAADMVGWVGKGLGGPDSGEWSDSEKLDLVNMAQVAMVTAFGHGYPSCIKDEDITTVSGTAEYTLTTDGIIRVLYLSSTAVPRLKQKDEEYYYRIGGPATSSSDPWAWCPTSGSNTNATSVTLIGKPNTSGKTVTAHLLVAPAAMSAEDPADESVLPAQFDLATVALAIRIGKFLSDQADGAGKMDSFVKWAKDIAEKTVPRPLEHVYQVEGRLRSIIGGLKA